MVHAPGPQCHTSITWRTVPRTGSMRSDSHGEHPHLISRLFSRASDGAYSVDEVAVEVVRPGGPPTAVSDARAPVRSNPRAVVELIDPEF